MAEYYRLQNLPSKVTMGQTVRFYTLPQYNISGLTYNLTYELKGDTKTVKGTITQNRTGGTYDWVPAIQTFAPAITKSTQGNLKITITTLNGTAVVAEYSYNILMVVPDSIKPVISGLQIVRVNGYQGKSLANLTYNQIVMTLAGLYGASQAVTVKFDSQTIRKSVAVVSGTTNTTTTVGIGKIATKEEKIYGIDVTVEDSRGRTATASLTLTVYPYEKPQVTTAKIVRDENEQPKLTFEYDYQDTVAGVTNVLNGFSVQYTDDTGSQSMELGGQTSPLVLEGTFSLDKAYSFTIFIGDKVTSAYIGKTLNLPSGKPVMDIGADGKTVTFFGLSPESADEESLRIGNMAYFSGDKIYLGKNSEKTVIDLCNGIGEITGVNDGYEELLGIHGDAGVQVFSNGYIKLESSTPNNGLASIRMYSQQPNGMFEMPVPIMSLTVEGLINGGGYTQFNLYQGLIEAIGTFRARGKAEVWLSVDDGQQIRVGLEKIDVSNLTLPDSAGQWISGMTADKCIVASALSEEDYHPILRVNTAKGNVWNIGGNRDNVGIYGYYADRTENGSDYSTVWNTLTGELVHNKAFTASDNITTTAGDFLMPNGKSLRAKNAAGAYQTLVGLTSSDDVTLGYAGYSMNKGNTILHGGTGILFKLRTPTVQWNPYYKAGDSISVGINAAGYTMATNNVRFSIPLSKPVVGSLTPTVTSISGLTVVQNGKTLYGGANAKPSSYSAAIASNGNEINIVATMPNSTNATAYTACGIYASMTVKFS